jgi:ABC-type sugar transport system, periplasmic component
MVRKNSIAILAALCGALCAASAAFAQGGAKGDTLSISMLASVWPPYEQDKTLVPEIEKATNTKLSIEWSPRDGYRDKLSTVLASGKLPDVIMLYNNDDVEFLKKQGAIIPLDDLLAKYAPNYLSRLSKADYPFIRDLGDNKIYTINQLIDFPPLYSWMIRQDWLDRCGLKAPKTWNDWVAMWKAFRDKDANGDGNNANDIPLSGNVRFLQMAFGIKSESLFAVDDNGNYASVFEHPNYPQFLAAMADLYKEGLLDKEFITRGLPAKMTDLFVIMDNNTLGSVVTTAERARLSTEVLRQKDPKATWVCVTPLAGPGGTQAIAARPKITTTAAAITVGADPKKIQRIVQFLDYFYAGSGEELMNYGVEGTHHKTVAGKPVLVSPYIDGFVEARKAGLIFQPFAFNWLKDNYMQILTNGKSYDQLTDTKKLFYDGLFINQGFFNVTPPTFSTDAYHKYGLEVMPKLEELEAGIISGRIPLSEFKPQLAKLKASGLDAITKEGAAAWKKLSK